MATIDSTSSSRGRGRRTISPTETTRHELRSAARATGDADRARGSRAEQGRRHRRRHHARSCRRRPRLRRPPRAACVRGHARAPRGADGLMLYLYAFVRLSASVPVTTGIGGGRAVLVPLGTVAAIVGEVAGAIEPTDEHVLA